MRTDIHQYATLRDYLKIFFKHKTMIISISIITILTIYVSVSLYTPLHRATVKILIEGQQTTEAEYYDRYRSSVDRSLLEREIIRSTYVLERVVRALRLYNIPIDYEKKFSSRLKAFLIDRRTKKLKQNLEKLPGEKKQDLLFKRAVNRLKSNVKVNPIKGANMFRINVYDFNSRAAIIIANSVSRSYLIYDLEKQLAELQLKYGGKHSITIQVKDKIDELHKHLDGNPLPDIEAIGPASVKIMEQAKESSLEARYNKRLLLTLGSIFGLVLGLILAFTLESLDQTIKSPRDVETVLNIPFLGSIPKRKSKDKPLINNPHSTTDYAQFYHNLSDHLELLIKDKKLGSILITDAESSEDTANIIANVAICLAPKDANRKILIIDVNLRNPSISKVFNISAAPGIAEVLEGKILFEDAVQDVEFNVAALAAGKTMFNPATLLDTSRMSDVIKTAIEKYDIVLLAGADIRNFTDAVRLSSIIDALILVINEGKVRRQTIKYAIAPLEQKKANIIGAIINNRNLVIPKFIYNRL